MEKSVPPTNLDDSDRSARTVQDLAKFRLPAGFRGRSAWFVQLWWLAQALLFTTSPQLFYGWRRALLKIFGAKIGPRVLLRPSVRITYPWNVSIGANSWIGDNVELYSLGQISIGANVVVSQGAYLCSASHDYQSVEFRIYSSPIVIEPEAWLAAQVFVGPGITIGRGAVIGARSVVMHDIPAFAKAVGHPAKIVGSR